jgi:hypothetical protein
VDIGYWWESQRGKREDQDIGGWIILRWILSRQHGVGVDWIGLAQVRDKWRESSCECSTEPSGSIKFWEIIERLHVWWPLE